MSLIAPSYYVSIATPATYDGSGPGGIVGAAALAAYGVILPAVGGGQVAVVGIVEIGVVVREAVAATTFLLAIANLDATGVGDQSIRGASERFGSSSPSNAFVFTHWSDAGPSFGEVYREATLPSAIGASIQWTWPQESPLIIPVTDAGMTPGFGKIGLGIFNGNASDAGPAIDLYVRWAEFANIAEPTVLNSLAPPTLFKVRSLTPSSGPVAGGTFVTARGTGFYNVVTVVGSTVGAVTFTIVDDTTITFTTPMRGGAGVEIFSFATPLMTAAAPFIYV